MDKDEISFDVWMKQTRLNATTAAAVLGKTVRTIYQWKAGEREPDYGTRVIMAIIAEKGKQQVGQVKVPEPWPLTRDLT